VKSRRGEPGTTYASKKVFREESDEGRSKGEGTVEISKV